MTRTRLLIVVALLITVGFAAPTSAGQRQARGGSGGAHPGVAPQHAVPRAAAPVHAGGYPYHGYAYYRGYPYYRSYPYYYYRGYPHYYYPSFSVGIGFGIGFGFGFTYGYPAYPAYAPYPYYAYPPYPYYAYPPNPYPYYGYPPPSGTYGPPPSGTVSPSPGNYGYPSYSPPANPSGYYGNGSSVVVTPTRAYGSIRIQDAPRDAQVFADGRYVGVAEGLDGTRNQLKLAPGIHQIGVRRAGYQTLTSDVKVESGQTVVYRAAMRPLQSASSSR